MLIPPGWPDQGLAGVQQSTVTGLVFGSMYRCTGSLWLSVATHASHDVTAVAIIYFGLETAVARLVFAE
jgi:membrane protease YdiL (CAAX protease family)